jgi:TetR/AcrR family transcriptional repressor of nem operon
MAKRDIKNELLDSAERFVQKRGYSGFSFHDLAKEVGITTASIHYHFPTKAKLGECLVKRHTCRFMSALGDPDKLAPARQLRRYVRLFRNVIAQGRMCLCGIIAAEVDNIPVEIIAEVRFFFRENEHWLARVFVAAGLDTKEAGLNAKFLIAALEGAMLLARASGRQQSFDKVATTALGVLGL